MRLAFSLESWEACGGDSTMSAEDAIMQGNEHIDAAIEIFKEVSYIQTLYYIEICSRVFKKVFKNVLTLTAFCNVFLSCLFFS